MKEGDAASYELIKPTKTLKEILEVAVLFEEGARNFYTGLAPKVGKNLRWLVEKLAKEEQDHYDLFANLIKRGDIAEQIMAKVTPPVTDAQFYDAVQVPDLGGNPDDQEVLQYAMGREHLAMVHYRALADTTGPGPIKELLEYLANEEAQHKNELEKLYYETIHSGCG